MSDIVGDVVDTFRAAPAFAFYILVTLVVTAIIGLITVDVIDLGMNHFGDLTHRTHDIAFGLLFTTGVVGVLAQLRRPGRNVAGMVMALIPVITMIAAGVLAHDVDAVVRFNPIRYAAWVTLVVALLHPTGRTFLRSFDLRRVNRLMLALVAAAAVPLLAFASTNLRLQRTVSDLHGFMGHYGFMAALGFTVIAVGLLASLRPAGWRLTALTAGLLPASLGIDSLLYPDAASSLDTTWALAAITWGVAFIAVAMLDRRAVEPGPPGRRAATPGRFVGARPSA